MALLLQSIVRCLPLEPGLFLFVFASYYSLLVALQDAKRLHLHARPGVETGPFYGCLHGVEEDSAVEAEALGACP